MQRVYFNGLKHLAFSARTYPIPHFVKNSGLGFAIPYFHNGQSHDYVPDFIIRLQSESGRLCYLILETKGFDPLEGVKSAASQRWVKAVNTDGKYGFWQYAIAKRPENAAEKISKAAEMTE